MARVFIVEDVVSHGELLRATLGVDRSLSITLHSDGLKAYRAVQQEPPDLIVLDIILPSLPGLAVARLLKFSDRYRHIPIVMMSSITDQDIHQRVMDTGADAFMPKPLDLPALQKEVRKLLDQAEARP